MEKVVQARESMHYFTQRATAQRTQAQMSTDAMVSLRAAYKPQDALVCVSNPAAHTRHYTTHSRLGLDGFSHNPDSQQEDYGVYHVRFLSCVCMFSPLLL